MASYSDRSIGHLTEIRKNLFGPIALEIGSEGIV